MPNTIELTTDGEGRHTIDMTTVLVVLVTRYNFYTNVWTLDILDILETPILTGIPLVPGVDLLAPYAQVKKTLGGLVLVEKNEGDYKDQDLLGNNTKLLWFPVGEEVEVPV